MRAETIRAEYEVEQVAQAQARHEKARSKADGEEIDPLAVVLEAGRNAAWWMRACRDLLGSLEEVRYRSTSAGEQLRAEVSLFERSMDRAAKIHGDIVRLGIEERLAKLSEQQAAIVGAAVERAIVLSTSATTSVKNA